MNIERKKENIRECLIPIKNGIEYQKLLQFIEDSKFIEALDEILVLVEGNNNDLYRNALYNIKRGYIKITDNERIVKYNFKLFKAN